MSDFFAAMIIASKVCAFVANGSLYEAPLLRQPHMVGRYILTEAPDDACYCDFAQAQATKVIRVPGTGIEITVTSPGPNIDIDGHGQVVLDAPVVIFLSPHSQKCKPQKCEGKECAPTS